MNAYLRWWRGVVLLGIAVNVAAGLPALIRPHSVQRLMRLEPLTATVWLRLAGLLLVDVSIFGAGTALRPTQVPIYSYLTSIERLISGLFSLQVWLFNPWQSSTRPRAFAPLGLFDTTVGVVGTILLTLGLREHRRTETRGR